MPASSRDFAGGRRGNAALDIQIGDLQGMGLDEFPPRFDVVAHEHAEEFVSAAGVFHFYFQERAVGGVEGRFAELFGVHFAQAFETGDLQTFFAGGSNGGRQAPQVLQARLAVAAAQAVAGTLLAGAVLGDERADGKAEVVQVAQ